MTFPITRRPRGRIQHIKETVDKTVVAIPLRGTKQKTRSLFPTGFPKVSGTISGKRETLSPTEAECRACPFFLSAHDLCRQPAATCPSSERRRRPWLNLRVCPQKVNGRRMEPITS